MKLAFKFDSGKVISHEVFERAFTIGRSESCRLVIDSEGFSREHALIELVDGALYVTDLGSKNGVYINHIRLPKKMKVSYDLKLPLYMGDCFLTIDISKDLQDPDYLSLETHDKVAPDEVFHNNNSPRRITPKPAKQPAKNAEKRVVDGKGIIIAIIVLIAVFAISMNRDVIMSRKTTTEQKK